MSDVVTMQSLGTEEVKQVLALGVRAAELIDALSDGVGLSDLGALLRAAKAVKPAVEAIKSGRLVPAIKDLDEVEKADLKAWAVAELNLKDDELEAKIEKAIAVAVDLTDLVKAIS